MKFAVALQSQVAFGNLNGRTRIDAVQTPHPGCHELRPPAAATAHVKAHRVLRQLRPREHFEVFFEQCGVFLSVELRLIKALPFVAETVYGS